jgi:ubiquitin-associated domain-containing protein 2
MFQSGPSGFSKAPLTQGICVLTGVMSILNGVLVDKSRTGVSLFDLTSVSLKRYELWRYLSSPFVFSSASEFIFGMLLVYVMRQFERRFGAKKFGVCE